MQREWLEKNYYEILGVPESATPKEVTRAYRKLARENHPDTNPGDAAAEERFKEVSAAYDVVGDEARRKEYDEVRAMGPLGGYGFSGGAPGGAQGFRFTTGQGGFDGDFGDLFGLFNRGRRASSSRGAGPQRGKELEAQLHLSFREAVRGVTTTVSLASEVPCKTCLGSRSAPGSAPRQCSACGGRGVVDDEQGLFSFSSPCTACAGHGSVVTEPCPTCHGSGLGFKRREVRVRVPAGVADGQKIRLKGRGAPGRNGGPPGDLNVVVTVAPDPVFARKGRDLLVTVPISFPDAVLGSKVTVATLEEDTVTLKIPPGTTSGRTFRVKGRGVEASAGRGDLLVKVEIAVPRDPSPAVSEAVESLARVLAAERSQAATGSNGTDAGGATPREGADPGRSEAAGAAAGGS